MTGPSFLPLPEVFEKGGSTSSLLRHEATMISAVATGLRLRPSFSTAETPWGQTRFI